MSFHEKSAWACLLSITIVFVPYFVIVLQYPMSFVGLFVLAVAGLVALLVGFHILNALATPSIRKTGDVPALDELDRIIELRAAKMSGIVLGVIVLVWSMNAMIAIPALGINEFAQENIAGNTAGSPGFVIPVTQAVLWVHFLFAGFVFANIAYYGGIVVAYRRMANG